MKGWKTWTGASIMAVSAALKYLGYADVASTVETIGMAVLAVGIGHKIEKGGV